MPWARANFTSTTRTIPAAVTKKEKRKKTREGALSAQREPFSTIRGIIIVVVIFELFCLLYIYLSSTFFITRRVIRAYSSSSSSLLYFSSSSVGFCVVVVVAKRRTSDERKPKKKKRKTGFYPPRFWIKIDPHRAKTPHTRKDIDANVKPHRRR
jgi:hypothetical protein